MRVCGQLRLCALFSAHADTSHGTSPAQPLCSLGLGSLTPADWDAGSVFGLVCVWCCAVLFAASHSLVYSGEASRLCR